MPTSNLSMFANFSRKKPEIDETGKKLLKSGYRYLKDIPASEIAHGDLIHVYDLKTKAYFTGMVEQYQEGDHLDYQMASTGTATWAMTLMTTLAEAHLIKVLAKGVA